MLSFINSTYSTLNCTLSVQLIDGPIPVAKQELMLDDVIKRRDNEHYEPIGDEFLSRVFTRGFTSYSPDIVDEVAKSILFGPKENLDPSFQSALEYLGTGPHYHVVGYFLGGFCCDINGCKPAPPQVIDFFEGDCPNVLPRSAGMEDLSDLFAERDVNSDQPKIGNSNRANPNSQAVINQIMAPSTLVSSFSTEDSGTKQCDWFGANGHQLGHQICSHPNNCCGTAVNTCASCSDAALSPVGVVSSPNTPIYSTIGIPVTLDGTSTSTEMGSQIKSTRTITTSTFTQVDNVAADATPISDDSPTATATSAASMALKPFRCGPNWKAGTIRVACVSVPLMVLVVIF